MDKLINKRRDSEDYIDQKSFTIIILIFITLINTILYFSGKNLPFINPGKGLQYVFINTDFGNISIIVLTAVISSLYFYFYRMIQNDKYIGFLFALVLFFLDTFASTITFNNLNIKIDVPFLKIIFLVILSKSLYHSVRSAIYTRKINKGRYGI